MIVFDDIIRTLQSYGGVTVYFDNIINNFIESGLPYKIIGYENIAHVTELRKKRCLERYRNCDSSAVQEGVFHSSYYRLPSNSNLSVITTVHDFTYEKFIQGPALWVHHWQKCKAIKNSDVVICVSENTAKDLLQYVRIPEKKIRVVHNGVSGNYYPLSQSAKINNEVLFVGARGGYKNFDLAVKTIAAFPELVLSVVGGGDFSEKERALLERYIPSRYKWLGRLSNEQLNQEYNKAYALLYPSDYEGFGIPVLEAMRAGCPVVAVNSSSIPEVAGDAAYLVNHAHSNEFIEGLRFIDSNRELLRNRGFLQANKFSWEKCYQETLNIYKEFI
ncbi:glycosyltransferase family 1 protein [Pectobacterium brasiliense]|uniref:glycosyltransferase family 4 protein n=1 Tax=Pectobacterium brasiliense TaxID=180957 RepID=UPI002A83B03C|nr:glycosyltransferase family 1 protein [Pectobacterium brasiliense]MDY4368060.1 glycosyltransferase family 1 protein [Pectobacterium brasiliense]MDY7057592.1 glycosyltransferase family 1 protein [Pectobacterium brasiliense]